MQDRCDAGLEGYRKGRKGGCREGEIQKKERCRKGGIQKMRKVETQGFRRFSSGCHFLRRSSFTLYIKTNIKYRGVEPELACTISV